MTLDEIQARLVEFNAAREWGQFHNAKDLAAGIAIEAAELQELFLWAADSEAGRVVEEKRAQVEEELADVFIQALNFAAACGINVLAAIEKKIALNEQKYPVDKSRGSAAKYTELE